jgi:endonuclease/exonuclease/phosphatase family metal-dependent hydrolase
VLLRSWNLFHGNTLPPRRRRYVEQMVRLVCENDPVLVCLQEVPPFALPHLERWAGRTAVGDVAMRARIPGPLGVKLTDLHSGFIRSGVEGQANAMLVAPGVEVLHHEVVALNPRRFRRREAERMGLPWRARLAWALERRICQMLRLRLADGRIVLAANLHATSYRTDKRLADAELRRAASFVDAFADADEPVILGGDFNVTTFSSPTLRELAGPEWGFSAPGPGLDHVLMRGLTVVEGERHWPDERRRHGTGLLSDHAPVEVVAE